MSAHDGYMAGVPRPPRRGNRGRAWRGLATGRVDFNPAPADAVAARAAAHESASWVCPCGWSGPTARLKALACPSCGSDECGPIGGAA